MLLGGFEAEYLTLPEEVLVTVMRDHQKYFAVEDAAGKLAPHFLAVLNTEVERAGNRYHSAWQRARAALAVQRCSVLLELRSEDSARDRVEMLKSVTFQKDLGSYFCED